MVNLLLSASHPQDPSPHQILPSASLSTTFVTPSDEKLSVKAINTQLVVGTKDTALRNAANVLSRAAANVNSFVERGEVHWGQAVLARKANWSLIPKPLPPFTQRKDIDHGARDFMISYGLEDCRFE